jgi:hypothetical protein
VAGAGPEPVPMPVAQWPAEPGLSGDLRPVSSRVQQDRI